MEIYVPNSSIIWTVKNYEIIDWQLTAQYISLYRHVLDDGGDSGEGVDLACVNRETSYFLLHHTTTTILHERATSTKLAQQIHPFVWLLAFLDR